MKRILLFILILCPVLTHAQKVDRYVVSAGGEYFEAATTNISWTLGEAVTGNFTLGELLVTQGFHQGNMMVTTIGDREAGFDLRAYPNPVMDILLVESEKQGMKYRLVDVYGKVVENGTIDAPLYELDFSSLPSGIYFLWVEDNQTHKILKK